MARLMDDATLERVLADVGAHLDHAAPSRMRDGVRMRIAERRAARDARRRRDRLVPVAVTALLLVIAVALASPQVRATAQEFLHLRGIDIFRVPALPTLTPSAPPSRSDLFDGQRVSLAEARARAGFRLVVPAALGDPDEVYLSAIPTGDRVTLVYLAPPERPGTLVPGVSAVIVEMRARLDTGFMAKIAGGATAIEEVSVNGGPGFWLAGEPHFFFYRDATGTVRQETLRLAGNTLLWQQGDLTFRVEAQVSRDEALRIASSLR